MGMIFKFDENDERQDWLSSGVDENAKPKARISPQERYKNQLAIKTAIESTYNKKVNKKVNSKPNNMNKTVSIVVSVILGIVTVGTVFMSPEFLESDYVSPSGAFWLKWVLTALGALGTYLSGNNAAKQ